MLHVKQQLILVLVHVRIPRNAMISMSEVPASVSGSTTDETMVDGIIIILGVVVLLLVMVVATKSDAKEKKMIPVPSHY